MGNPMLPRPMKPIAPWLAEQHEGFRQRHPDAPEQRDADQRPGQQGRGRERRRARCRELPPTRHAAPSDRRLSRMNQRSATGRISRLQTKPSTSNPARI